ncbi:MAG: hypothetical protein K0S97_2678 [Chloroflexota bacterium]|nr:hypothetical protein [Chloroflexota bacterium]
MSDLLVLVVVIGFPAATVLGFLGLMTLGVAAVADLDGNGLVRAPSGPPDVAGQPAPGSPSSESTAFGSPTSGPAARMSSVTPSA